MKTIFLSLLLMSGTAFSGSTFSLLHRNANETVNNSLVQVLTSIANKANVKISIETTRDFSYSNPTYHIETVGTFNSGEIVNLPLANYDLGDSTVEFIHSFLEKAGASNISITPTDNFGFDDYLTASWKGEKFDPSRDQEIEELRERINQLEELLLNNK